VNTHPANRPAADRATSDPAPLVPTATTADPPPAGPDPVTAREIADFLRDLAELRSGARGDDPAERAAFLARKAELLARIAADPAPTPTMAPEGRTP
jgi:hypothetical protein